jgi:DNA-binding PadR family transcriptional regulator
MNATAASLLGLLDLSGGELTGAELVRVAQQRIGDFWSLTRSQVYRELAALEREGHVEPGPRGVRESRPYRITASGRKVYRTWLTERLPGDTVRVPLLLALAFGSVLPKRRVAALLHRSAEEHRNRLNSYRALAADLDKQGVDVWTQSTLSFGIHYEEAVLRWFDALPDEVTDLVDANQT